MNSSPLTPIHATDHTPTLPMGLLAVTLLLLAILIGSGLWSRIGAAAGLVEERLTPCGSLPNCVCSDFYSESGNTIAPLLTATAEANDVMQALRQTLIGYGGELVEGSKEEANANPLYLAATFTTTPFGFVADFEARFDPKTHELHFRSASRVGFSDFGSNRHRVEQIRHLTQQLLALGPATAEPPKRERSKKR